MTCLMHGACLKQGIAESFERLCEQTRAAKAFLAQLVYTASDMPADALGRDFLLQEKQPGSAACAQAVAPCRVLLTQPRLVLMDESTSALDTDNEAHLFRCLQEAGIRYVSIGHRPTLAHFHSRVLRLAPRDEAAPGEARCGWELYDAERDRAAARSRAPA